MIVGITIRNFKSIQEVDNLSLDRFHVLVGANGSGKSTFLDALHFIRDCLVVGPLGAVDKRGIPDLKDLTFMRKGGKIEFELWMDGDALIPSQKGNLLHYQLTIGSDKDLGVCIHSELLRQFSKSWLRAGGAFDFSEKVKPKRLLGKTGKKTDFFQRENSTYQDSFVFEMNKSSLAHTPPDEARYPTANAVKKLLTKGVRFIQLDSPAMRQPCPATRGTEMELDGTNIPRVIGLMYDVISYSDGAINKKRRVPNNSLIQWVDHLRYALPELNTIQWNRRIVDNAEFLLLKYQNGLICPQWLASDGTLRMLALTLPAFLPDYSGITMVEEPENGVHPKALEVILRALSTIPDAQVLVATHSPLVVQQVGKSALLCFSLGPDGTRIVHGDDHPLLKDWDGTPDLATVFAAGILG